MAITSVHTLIYSDDAAATRTFLREVLGWPYVASGEPNAASLDEDWLIFGSGRSELGVHPTMTVWEGEKYESPRHHEIALMCDDIQATVAELRGKGAEFNGEIADEGFGIGIKLKVPGADDILLYQPRHATAYDL
ncbi:MAG TPA: VOC family protein [Ilumatobacteraceae bacterium]|nr:VOC family protein [Ilumatobacteraceae bacterium]